MILTKGLHNKIAQIALDMIDKKLGKKFPIIDKITDIFQEHDYKLKEIQKQILEIKEKQNAKTCCCNKKNSY
tara:strand:- start:382 stop:597 length:216 start_codon:yes stop_codon:yes gene_type:complete